MMLIDGHFSEDGHGPWTLILVSTLMDGKFSYDAHVRLFYFGRSWMVILVRTVMDAHFSEDADGCSI